MQLYELKSPKGSRKRKKIVGRGRGSGLGKTSGRGENGQKSRSTGRSVVGSSEGGQMPLIRRLPKVGFRSHRPILNQIVTLEKLDNKFEVNGIVNVQSLKENGLIGSVNKPFKILGNGEITKALIVQAKSISKSAQEKIIKAGGKVEIIQKNNNIKEIKKKS